MSSLSQGIHNAVCIGIIFTGKHQSFNRPLPKVTILWEITENEKIKTFSRDYTYSYYEKAELRLHLESWRGRPCKLEIAKNNKNYKQVENVYRFPAKEQAPKRKSELIYFDISDKTTYSEIPNIPYYIVEKIKNSPEYKQSSLKL